MPKELTTAFPEVRIENRDKCQTRLPQLDGLRAVAMLGVTWFHWSPFGRHFLGSSIGAAGVQLFFVLSGYLITGILLDAKSRIQTRSDTAFFLRQFFVRRMLRLFPLLSLVIGMSIVLSIPPFPATWLWHICYLSNIYQFLYEWKGFGSNLWTLSVEEQFYLIWPLIIIFCPVRYLSIAVAFTVFTAPATRWYFWTFPSGLGEGCGDPNRLPLAAFDCLGMGSMLTLATRGEFVMHGRKFAVASGVFGLSFYFATRLMQNNLTAALEQTSIAGCFVWLVFRASYGFSGVLGVLLESGPVTYLGRISYGIYVYQGFVLFLWSWLLYSAPIPGYRIFERLSIEPSIYLNPATTTLVCLTLNFVLAALSWRFFEAPINDLRRFFPYLRPTLQSRLMSRN